ncbi:MAG TPA: TRAP transporter small permease [Burkholderiaceae bacterium]|nr:TRAP transporter small permease [Burkholderiaceae bacterium]
MDAGQPPASGEPRALRALGRAVSWTTTAATALAAAGVLASLALIAWAVVMRYAFNRAPVWVDDLVGLMLVAIVMLAAAQVLRRGEHIAVDVFTEKLSGRAARWAQALAAAAAGLVAVILIVNGWQTAMQSRQFGIVTEGRLEWPVWMLMLLLPLGGALMALVSVEALWRLGLGLPPAVESQHHPAQDE